MSIQQRSDAPNYRTKDSESPVFLSVVGKKKCYLDGITGNNDTQAQFDFVRE